MRFFLAVSREGSVSGAGRALGVKHTTVARRIRAFEERLGTRILWLAQSPPLGAGKAHTLYMSYTCGYRQYFAGGPGGNNEEIKDG